MEEAHKMKCQKCKMEIAYSFLDGVFCSCGFLHGKDIMQLAEKLFEGWKGLAEKIFQMRMLYFKSSFTS